MVVWPVARAIETRWWPSFTKYMSPTLYTSIGGSGAPRRWARASCSHRSRTRADRGRKRRSKSWGESTVPTMRSSLMVLSPP
jgi:hypothetical protein